MWSLSARDAAALRAVAGAIHDAYVDGAVEHDRANRVVVVPLLQEGWPGGPPAERVPTRETWRYREYRVTLFRARLVVRQVRTLHEPEDWADELMTYGVDFDADARQVRVRATEDLRITVDALDVGVEVSSEPGGHLRRRVGRLTGIQSDRWLDAGAAAAPTA